MQITSNIYNSKYLSPNFTATKEQYKDAVNYLKEERRQGRNSVIERQGDLIKNGIKNHYDKKFLWDILTLNPKKWRYSNSYKAIDLQRNGIKTLDLDRLDGIQYGIDVFGDLSMREIAFLAYRTNNLAVTRGCSNMCQHCFQNAVPAKKDELKSMPYEDFKKITVGFSTINTRINDILRNKGNATLVGDSSNSLISGFAAELTGFFYDSDGMNVISKDADGNEHDFIDMTEEFCNATGKKVIFDTAGWNPRDKKLQQRAEKYAEYLSQPDIDKKVEQVNLSANTFSPIYLHSYKLGYRAGRENDLTNPDIQKGKILYDAYICKIANMITTLGFSKNVSLLMTYATKFEGNMDGMYFEDLIHILNDVKVKSDEILKEKYSGKEYQEKSHTINKLIDKSINREENRSYYGSRCVYSGRYKELYNSKNHKSKEYDGRYTAKIADINSLSKKEYDNFLKNNMALIDTNGDLYYMNYDTSLRSMDKKLKLSTNGAKTPEIHNIEKRD